MKVSFRSEYSIYIISLFIIFLSSVSAARIEPCHDGFLRGDADGDGNHRLNDAVFILNFLFRGGTSPDCNGLGDANRDGSILLNDAVYLLNYLFRGGPAPVWEFGLNDPPELFFRFDFPEEELEFTRDGVPVITIEPSLADHRFATLHVHDLSDLERPDIIACEARAKYESGMFPQDEEIFFVTDWGPVLGGELPRQDMASQSLDIELKIPYFLPTNTYEVTIRCVDEVYEDELKIIVRIEDYPNSNESLLCRYSDSWSDVCCLDVSQSGGVDDNPENDVYYCMGDVDGAGPEVPECEVANPNDPCINDPTCEPAKDPQLPLSQCCQGEECYCPPGAECDPTGGFGGTAECEIESMTILHLREHQSKIPPTEEWKTPLGFSEVTYPSNAIEGRSLGHMEGKIKYRDDKGNVVNGHRFSYRFLVIAKLKRGEPNACKEYQFIEKERDLFIRGDDGRPKLDEDGNPALNTRTKNTAPWNYIISDEIDRGATKKLQDLESHPGLPEVNILSGVDRNNEKVGCKISNDFACADDYKEPRPEKGDIKFKKHYKRDSDYFIYWEDSPGEITPNGNMMGNMINPLSFFMSSFRFYSVIEDYDGLRRHICVLGKGTSPLVLVNRLTAANENQKVMMPFGPPACECRKEKFEGGRWVILQNRGCG